MKVQRWRYRDKVFKMGFCGVLLSLVLCCLGFVAPAWQNSGGLWIHSTLPRPLPGWMQIVRVLATVNVVAVGVGIVVEVYQDVCKKSSPQSDNYLIELFFVLAGLSGLAGTIMFAVKAHTSYPSGEGPFGSCRKTLFWAWGLQLVGSCLVLISVTFIAYSQVRNRRKSQCQMQIAAFRKTAPVGLNPYFVSRCVPVVRIVPVMPATQYGDSNA